MVPCPQVCHYTYVTQFRPHRVEECSEFYEKTCSIVFKERATNETVRKCYKPVAKVCNGQGPEECRTMYESSCTTKYVEKQPGKFVGDTGCERLPVEICGAGCIVEEGEEECHEKTISASVTVPEEACDLQPQEKCQGVYKLVPFLAPTQECKEVPREVCTFGVLKGQPGEKPLTTKWCYDPEAETDLLASGLSDEEDTAFPPRDPFLPPTDSFQFPQQSLEPLEDYDDYPETEDDSLSLPTYSGYQVNNRERDSLFYIPPAPELSQALEEEDREGRKVEDLKRQHKVGTKRLEEEQEEGLSFVEEFLETVKQDQEGPVGLRFGDQLVDQGITDQNTNQSNKGLVATIDKQRSEADRPLKLNEIIPEVFQFPGERETTEDRRNEKKKKKAKKNRKLERQKARKGGRRGKSKTGLVPKEFRPILSKIDREAQDRVKFVKGGPGTKLVGHRPIARVIKHRGEENPVSRTVVIENSPEAHQVFGIRNAPGEWGRDQQLVGEEEGGKQEETVQL